LLGEKIPGCIEYIRCLKRASLFSIVQLYIRLGCEYMFLDELKGLTPVEEKFIVLNSCYSFITKYNVPMGHR